MESFQMHFRIFIQQKNGFQARIHQLLQEIANELRLECSQIGNVGVDIYAQAGFVIVHIPPDEHGGIMSVAKTMMGFGNTLSYRSSRTTVIHEGGVQHQYLNIYHTLN